MLPVTLNLKAKPFASESGIASTIFKRFSELIDISTDEFIAKAGYSSLYRDGKSTLVFYFNHAKMSILEDRPITSSKAKELTEIIGGDELCEEDFENMCHSRTSILKRDLFTQVDMKSVLKAIQNADRCFCIYSLADKEFFTEYQI